MKRIVSLVCALMLLCAAVPASAGAYDLDYYFSQALALHSLMLEKAAMAEMLGTGINGAAEAFDQPVLYVRVLRYDTQGAFMRYLQQLSNGTDDAEIPEMSDALLSSYDKSLPSTLVTQLLNQSGVSLAAASTLTVSSTGLAAGMTQSALVVLDFGTDCQFVCIFTPQTDGIVSASAWALPTTVDVLTAFCDFFALSSDDVKSYTGDVLYQKNAHEALREYAHSLHSSMLSAISLMPTGMERPEALGHIEEAALRLQQPSTPTRLRLLPLTEELLPAASAPAVHTQLSNLVTAYNASVTLELSHALSYFNVSDCFDMPRSMPAAALVQAEYDVRLEDEIGTYSVVCVFTPTAQGCVLGSAHFAVNYIEPSFIDALTTGEYTFTVDPALIIELEP